MTMSRFLLAPCLVVAAFGLACAHRGGASYGSAAPLGDVVCLEDGDSNSSRCGGIVYGDYEQYPKSTPLEARQVTLTKSRRHISRIVIRPGFEGGSSVDTSWSFPTLDSGPSASSPASPPRMDPVVVSAPSSSPAPTTVSPRPN
jgi:hypothetical protein